MSGRVEGKVALITGAARGQGRDQAVRLAEEGADIIAVDRCADLDSVGYAMASRADLDETARLVEATGRRIVADVSDIRDRERLTAVVQAGVAELGGLDIVSANAGICTIQAWDEVTPEIWQDTVDINLTGAWNTAVASLPHLIERGGGSIIFVNSVSGMKGHPFLAPYVAAKHAVVGLMRSLSNEVARHSIRVNSVHPAGVNTPMLSGVGGMSELIDKDPSTAGIFANSLPVEFVEAADTSNAILFLASDESRYMTGVMLPIDAGCTNR